MIRPTEDSCFGPSSDGDGRSPPVPVGLPQGVNGNGSEHTAAPATAAPRPGKRAARRALRALLPARPWILTVGHLAVFVAVYWLAFLLRFDFSIPAEYRSLFWATLPWVLALKVAVFYVSGHYRGWWSYVTFADLLALLRAALLSLTLIVVVDYFCIPERIPRSVVLLDCVMTVVMLGAARAGGRMLRDQVWPALHRKSCRPALLVGAARSVAVLAHQINSHPDLRHRVRGLLADGRRMVGQQLGQIPVLGKLCDVRAIAALHGIEDVLVVAGTLSGRKMRRLMENCQEGRLSLKIIPPLEDLFNGDRWIPLRDLDIGDLLRRGPVELESQAIGELLQGRRIMVTGAGGSIGSEICRQVLRFAPAELVLLGRGENRIFAIDRELRGLKNAPRLCPVIGNVTDEDCMRQVFERYRPEVIFHAAAHKHVPLMEANVGEAIKNNVLGTKRLADLADELDAKCFVLVSTDKAVNPTSVMGATKHLAEHYVRALSRRSATRFVAVRLGNVLGSAGSAVPIFQDQIRRGGPITVTDARMTRYFMTIPEASQLILQATAMGRGGEIFVLDMGDPVRIVDLARDLVRLSGLPPHAIDIAYTGVRPGEKLHEELCSQDERMLPTAHPKVYVAEHGPCNIEELGRLLSVLEQSAGESEDVLRNMLGEAIPGFQSSRHNKGHAARNASGTAAAEPVAEGTRGP